jgi:hypothetical protein
MLVLSKARLKNAAISLVKKQKAIKFGLIKPKTAYFIAKIVWLNAKVL